MCRLLLCSLLLLYNLLLIQLCRLLFLCWNTDRTLRLVSFTRPWFLNFRSFVRSSLYCSKRIHTHACMHAYILPHTHTYTQKPGGTCIFTLVDQLASCEYEVQSLQKKIEKFNHVSKVIFRFAYINTRLAAQQCQALQLQQNVPHRSPQYRPTQ